MQVTITSTETVTPPSCTSTGSGVAERALGSIAWMVPVLLEPESQLLGPEPVVNALLS